MHGQNWKNSIDYTRVGERGKRKEKAVKGRKKYFAWSGQEVKHASALIIIYFKWEEIFQFCINLPKFSTKFQKNCATLRWRSCGKGEEVDPPKFSFLDAKP